MHQVGGLDHEVLHTVGHSAVHGLLHVVDLLAVTGLHMVDDDLGGEGTADRPIRVSFLQSILDALDVGHAAVVEGGAEGDHQQLIVADVILVAAVVLGGIAGVAAKVIGVGLFALDQLLLCVGQSVPSGLGGSALLVGVVVALLHIDGVDQIGNVLCSQFICLLTGNFAGCGGRACHAGSSGAGCRPAAAGEHTGAEGEGGQSGRRLVDRTFSHVLCSFPVLDTFVRTGQKGTGKRT